MTAPTLEDLEGAMNRACIDTLGDTIVYTPVSGDPVTKGYVDYPEALRDISSGMVIEQDITVQILIADAPVRPSAACRITLGKVAGKTFRPINVRRDESGDHWEFEVESVNA